MNDSSPVFCADKTDHKAFGVLRASIERDLTFASSMVSATKHDVPQESINIEKLVELNLETILKQIVQAQQDPQLLIEENKNSVDREKSVGLKDKEDDKKGETMTEEDKTAKNDIEIESTLSTHDSTASNFSCSLCFEEKDLGFKLQLCDHKYCEECLITYLHMKIFSGGVLNIRCPTCGDKIQENEIQQLVDDHTFTKYQQFLLEASLRSDPNCRWCPNPGCSHPVVGNPLDSQLTCEKCLTHFCYNCRDYWHPDETCQQAQKAKKKTKDEIKSEKKQVRSGKKCPCCGVFINKFDGCNHITCVYCKFEWCWICEQEFLADHYFDTKCKGLQFAKHPRLKRAGQKTLKVGKYSLITVGLGVGGLVAVAILIPTTLIGLPVYGGYKLIKR